MSSHLPSAQPGGLLFDLDVELRGVVQLRGVVGHRTANGPGGGIPSGVLLGVRGWAAAAVLGLAKRLLGDESDESDEWIP